MRAVFPEFYRIKAEDFEKVWEDCIFVFDANVLLNLYRYSQKTSKELIDILTHEKIKERVWIPHQFALEYQKNRLEVIADQKLSYETLLKDIDDLEKKYERHPFLNMKRVMANAVESVQVAKRQHPKWNQDDSIRESLTDLFSSKTGAPFNDVELQKVFEEGKVRFSKKIPPGYLDAKKGGEAQFGDLIGWKQMLSFAKKHKKPIIFINDENHEDWWWRIKGELVGSRFELTKEMNDYAGVFFCMYNSRFFHKRAARYLNRKENKQVAQEIEEITKSPGIEDDGKSVSHSASHSPEGTETILAEDVGKSETSEEQSK